MHNKTKQNKTNKQSNNQEIKENYAYDLKTNHSKKN